MKTEDIHRLGVGSLVKYVSTDSRRPADMGLLSEIMEIGDRKIYRFIWTSNPKKPTSETEDTLSLTPYTLIQVAE